MDVIVLLEFKTEMFETHIISYNRSGYAIVF